MKPNFLCIGAQKAGTSSLKNYLNQHPDIFVAKKELHFFDKEKNLKLGAEDFKRYEEFFPRDKKLVGEKTPSYSHLEYAMERIYQYAPNIRLILLLREPVSRAYSQYNMYQDLKIPVSGLYEELFKKQELPLSLLTSNGKNFITRGYYAEQIKFILKRFPKKNLYISIAEEIKKEKQSEYNKIFAFLGVEPVPLNLQVDANVRTYREPLPPPIFTKLREIYKPHNQELYKILGREIPSWEKAYKAQL